MKNFQKIALALTVGVMAIGFSAFKTVEKHTDADLVNVYHYVSTASDGKINFALGEPGLGVCSSGPTPCRFESNSSLTSPLTVAAIQSQSTVTATRP